MKRKIILLALIIGFPIFIIAQISDRSVLLPNHLIVQQDGEYDLIMTEEQSFTKEIGNPQLPVITISYVIPYHATVTGIEITSMLQEKLNGNYYIYPAQPPRALDWSEAPAFVEPNQDIYNSNQPYPNKTVEIVSDGYIHEYHVVTVAIYPKKFKR